MTALSRPSISRCFSALFVASLGATGCLAVLVTRCGAFTVANIRAPPPQRCGRIRHSYACSRPLQRRLSVGAAAAAAATAINADPSSTSTTSSDFGTAMPERPSSPYEELGIKSEQLALGVDPSEVLEYIGTYVHSGQEALRNIYLMHGCLVLFLFFSSSHA